jgi:phage/plasmid-like protein (TIGR03299 family)
MTANVERMMYTGQTPWHGVGTKIENPMGSAEAIKLAGLDWDVDVAPIITDDQVQTNVDEYRVTRRRTDEAILGVVSRGWKPIQNRDAFKLFDRVLGEGKAFYNDAGSLQGGSKVFITAKLPEPILVGSAKDPVDRYILLSNAHDGTRPLQMLFTPVRVVCCNTLNLALDVKNGNDETTKLAPRVAISHRVMAQTLELQKAHAIKVMGAAHRWYETFGDWTNFIASRQLNVAQVKNIVAEVFPPNKKKEVTPAIIGHRTEVERLFVDGKGHETAGVAGTGWALLNAFTEYADHSWASRGKGVASDRSYSILMGGSKGLKNRATKVITECVAA